MKVRKGKLRFVRKESFIMRSLMTARGAWYKHPIAFAYKKDLELDPDAPVIGLGQTSDDGYTYVLTEHGPMWVRVLELTDGPEPEKKHQ